MESSSKENNLFSRFFNRFWNNSESRSRSSVDGSSKNSPIPSLKSSDSNMENENQSLKPEELPEFCEQLDLFIERVDNVLNSTYADGFDVKLQKKLKRQVNELICIKNQFQTISENIEIYSQQLEAVKKDFIDMNNKLKELRQQERKSKILLKKQKRTMENQALRIRNIDPLPPIPGTVTRSSRGSTPITNFLGLNTNQEFSRFNFNFNRNDQNNTSLVRFRGRSILNIPSENSIQEMDSISITSTPFSDV